MVTFPEVQRRVEAKLDAVVGSAGKCWDHSCEIVVGDLAFVAYDFRDEGQTPIS